MFTGTIAGPSRCTYQHNLGSPPLAALVAPVGFGFVLRWRVLALSNAHVCHDILAHDRHPCPNVESEVYYNSLMIPVFRSSWRNCGYHPGP